MTLGGLERFAWIGNYAALPGDMWLNQINGLRGGGVFHRVWLKWWHWSIHQHAVLEVIRRSKRRFGLPVSPANEGFFWCWRRTFKMRRVESWRRKRALIDQCVPQRFSRTKAALTLSFMSLFVGDTIFVFRYKSQRETLQNTVSLHRACSRACLLTPNLEVV